MELSAAVHRRRMVRSFAADPVAPATVDHLVDLARRAPSAGNTQAWRFVVLEGADTGRLWEATLGDPARRAAFRWQGLLAAPVLVLPLVRPDAYVDRYAEGDKAATGLGAGRSAWPVPYWWVDVGMVVHGLLLGAVDAGLGALFYGLFDHEEAALAALGVPDGWRAPGVVALGRPAGDDVPGRSAGRPRPPLGEVLHRGGWRDADR
ncbi:MAG TPA: nitroreductase family protein [Acidimicrobiales bacterium]